MPKILYFNVKKEIGKMGKKMRKRHEYEGKDQWKELLKYEKQKNLCPIFWCNPY